MVERDRVTLVEGMARHPVFSPSPHEALATLADQGATRTYARRTYLFHQGDAADRVYFLIRGRAEVSASSPAGKRQLLGILEPGRLLGELGILADSPRTASILFLEDSVVWSVDADLFRSFLAEHPGSSLALLGALARLAESSEAFAEDLLWLDLKGRVAKRLLQLGVLEARGEGRVVPAMTHADLASLCGGSRENVSRVLSEFERRGFVRRTDRRYVLLEPAALKRLAEG